MEMTGVNITLLSGGKLTSLYAIGFSKGHDPRCQTQTSWNYRGGTSLCDRIIKFNTGLPNAKF
jgi:hypothetical protein